MAIMFSSEVIKEYRKAKRLTLAELSEGICDITTLRRIEKGDRAPSVYVFRKLMSKLGLAPNKFYASVASKEEIAFFNLYYEIEALVMNRRFDEAHDRIAELEMKEQALSKKENGKIREQLVLVQVCNISQGKNNDANERIRALKYAIQLTLPNFNESKIPEYMLSYEEVSLLNMLAVAYQSIKGKVNGIDILFGIKESMDKHYFDEYEKSRGYTLTLLNLSTALGFAHRHAESLRMSNIGIEQCVKHKRLRLLPNFKFNKACALFFQGGQGSHEVAKLAIEAIFALRNNEDFEAAQSRQGMAEKILGVAIPF